MASLNRALIIGNLTRDPEMRYTTRGTALAEISVAVNRSYKGDDGERKEEVTYVDCTCWNRLAEVTGQYLRKGSLVFIEGRLHQQTWTDKQTGQARSKLSVVAENLQILGSRQESGVVSPSPPRPLSHPPPRSQPAPAAHAPGVDPELDVD